MAVQNNRQARRQPNFAAFDNAFNRRARQAADRRQNRNNARRVSNGGSGG